MGDIIVAKEPKLLGIQDTPVFGASWSVKSEERLSHSCQEIALSTIDIETCSLPLFDVTAFNANK